MLDVPAMLQNMPGHLFRHWWQHYQRQPFGPAIQTFMQARQAHLTWITAVPESDLTIDDFTPGIKDQVEPPQQDWRAARASVKAWLTNDGTKT